MPSSSSAAQLSLWLVPAADDPLLVNVRMLIEIFARRYGAPPFPPHLTVFGSIAAPPGPERDAVKDAVAAVARETPPLTLQQTGVGESSSFFRCLYLAFEDPVVTSLRGRVGPGVGKSLVEAARPHVSLLYAELPAAERQTLARTLPSLGSLTFDALELIAPGDGAAGWNDVAGWRTEARFRLGGA